MKKRIISLLLALFLLIPFVDSVPIYAAAVPALSVESKAVSPGEQFSVAVKLQNAANVYNGNFTLQYDSAKLTVESYAIGSIFNGHTTMCNTDYQSAGNLIRFTFSGAYALKGDGTLVSLTFKVKASASGTASLQFNAYKIYDANGASMAPTAANGSVTIASAPTVIPKLTVEGSSVSAGSTISVPVKITNSSGVYNGNFTLQYDNTKLSVESYSEGSIFNGHTVMCNTDYQSAGNLIRFTFSGAYALKGDGALVTITFKAKTSVSGTASLQFTAYKIYDANGTSMNPTAANGSVIINAAPQKTLTSISVYSNPSKTTYYIGDTFSSSGLKIKATYSDGSTETLTSGFSVSSPVMSTSGTKTVTVTYSGKITTFDITVIPVGGANITVESKKAYVGKTVSITVSLENNPGLVNLLLSVGYDQSVMKLIGVEDGGIISKPNNSPTYTANPYKLAWEDDTTKENYTGNGVLTTLIFEIAEDAPEGEYAITLSCKNGDAFNVDLIDVSVTTINGSITVSTVLLGDVNGDGTVSGKDRTILSRYLAGWPGYDEQVNLDACDINGDGDVSGKDRTILSRYLAGWGEAYDIYFE